MSTLADRAAAHAHATRAGVSPAIHPDDHIYRWMIDHWADMGFASRAGAIEHYFVDGGRSAGQLRAIMAQHLPAPPVPAVLEFASGYGMVSRHLARDPGIALWSSDIHPQAVAFLDGTLGIRAVPSAPQPEALALPQPFDVVFALSFFSHMPITTWARWLVRLSDATAPGGLLVFTTHGMVTHKLNKEPPLGELGFWFAQASEQVDLPGEQYGATITTPAFVQAHIPTLREAALVEFREGYWWNNQDLWVLRRGSG